MGTGSQWVKIQGYSITEGIQGEAGRGSWVGEIKASPQALAKVMSERPPILYPCSHLKTHARLTGKALLLRVVKPQAPPTLISESAQEGRGGPIPGLGEEPPGLGREKVVSQAWGWAEGGVGTGEEAGFAWLLGWTMQLWCVSF